MDPAFPFELPPARSQAGTPPSSMTVAVGAQALAAAADLAQFERLLMTLAVHSQGAGFHHAYLLRWDARQEKLQGRCLAETNGGPVDLARALDLARMSKNRRSERNWRRSVFSAAELGHLASTAWRGGGAVVGEDGSSRTPWCDAPAIGALTLVRHGRPFALLVGSWKTAESSEARRDVLETVRRIANAAIVSVDQSEGARRFTQQAAAIAELARATSSPGNLGEVLQRVVALAAQGMGGHGSALWLRRPDRNAHLEVTHGVVSERERFGRSFQSLATAVIESGRGRVVDDPTHEFLLSPEVAAQLVGVAVEPLVAFDRTLGAIAVYVRQRPGDLPSRDIGDQEFLKTVARLAALAVEHASRFRDLAQAEQRANDMRSELARLDWLSSVGERATKIAPETRQPLASIQSFAKKVRSTLTDDDPRHDYVEIILAEVERLDQSLRASFDQVPVRAPTLRVERINDIVHRVLQREAEALVRRRVRLVKKLAPDLPALLLDPERIRHALDNMLKSALESVSMGGRIRFETRRVRHFVVVELAHDGACSTGGALEKVFEPFETNPTIGGSLVFGAVERIVREHGGEVRVRADGEWSTVVAFTLPIQANQDRRTSPGDRRQRSRDRRKRFPDS